MDERAEAIELLYRTRFNAFLTVVASSIGDRDGARDVVQEAFARALRSRRELRDSGALEAWVWRIAMRAAHERRPNGYRMARLDELGDPRSSTIRSATQGWWKRSSGFRRGGG